jgi:hypothetical protein
VDRILVHTAGFQNARQIIGPDLSCQDGIVQPIHERILFIVITEECFAHGGAQATTVTEQLGKFVSDLPPDGPEPSTLEVPKVVFQGQFVDHDPIKFKLGFDDLPHLSRRSGNEVDPRTRVLLLKGAHQDRGPWDVALVFRALKRGTYEPLDRMDIRVQIGSIEVPAEDVHASLYRFDGRRGIRT